MAAKTEPQSEPVNDGPSTANDLSDELRQRILQTAYLKGYNRAEEHASLLTDEERDEWEQKDRDEKVAEIGIGLDHMDYPRKRLKYLADWNEGFTYNAFFGYFKRVPVCQSRVHKELYSRVIDQYRTGLMDKSLGDDPRPDEYV